jgi:hypothetical protein
MSHSFLFWEYATQDRLRGPFTSNCNVTYNLLYGLVVNLPSPFLSVTDSYVINYTGSSPTIRVYIQFHFTSKPSQLIVGLMDAVRTGCVVTAPLEIVPFSLFNGYAYIGNAIIVLDGSTSVIGPQIGQVNSWVVTLMSTTGVLPPYSPTGRDTRCYISFTPI